MRRLARADVNPALNSVVDVLTCPAGHKYEVVGIGYYSDTGGRYEWQTYLHYSGGYLAVDDTVCDTPRPFIHTNYNALVLLAGESLTLYVITSRSTRIAMPVFYVDVSPVL